jgi:hypothetical protein
MAVETTIGIFDNEDGRFCLTVMGADERTYALFDERDLQGGGYTWEGIVRALAEMLMVDAISKLDIGAEADNAYIYCGDRQILEEIAALVRTAVTDHHLLIAAIDHAGANLE